jgi:hypothetical protein
MKRNEKNNRSYFETSLSIAMGLIGALVVPFLFILSRIRMFK